MRTLSNLTGIMIEKDWSDSKKAVVALHHELSPGIFVHVGLGPAGLLVMHGEKAVGFPLDELVGLARKVEPSIGSHTPALASPVRAVK